MIQLAVYFMAARRTDTPTKRHKPEEIIVNLRQVDVLAPQGASIADAVCQVGVTEMVQDQVSELLLVHDS